MTEINDNGNGSGWDKGKVIDKVRKLLALTQSPNKNEAEVAAIKAQELLTKFNLHIAEIGVAGPDQSENKVLEEHFNSGSHKWEIPLANLIGKYNYCKCLRHPWKKTFSYIGRAQNVEVAKEIFQWVVPQIWRIAHYEYNKERKQRGAAPKGFQVSFAFGLVDGIGMKMREQFERQQQENVKCTALVVRFDLENDAFVKMQYPRLKHTNVRHTRNFAAYSRGVDAAGKVSLSLRNQVENHRQLR